MLSIINKTSSVKASLVRRNPAPALVASFAMSTPPLVWHLDLEKASSFVLTLNEQDGEWDLGYTPAQGAFISVAHFDDRLEAESAYNAVKRALHQPLSDSVHGTSLSKKIFYILLIAALLLFLSQSFLSRPANHVADQAAQQSGELSEQDWESAPKQDPTKIQNGVPMTADDVLPKDVH